MDLTAHLKDYRAKVAASALPKCIEASKLMPFGSMAGFTSLSAAMRTAEAAAASGDEDRYRKELQLHAEGMVTLFEDMVRARLGDEPAPLDLVDLLSEPDGWKWFKFSTTALDFIIADCETKLVRIVPRYTRHFLMIEVEDNGRTLCFDAGEVPFLFDKLYVRWKAANPMCVRTAAGGKRVTDFNRHGQIDDWSLPMRWN